MKLIGKFFKILLILILIACIIGGACVFYALKYSPHHVSESQVDINDSEVSGNVKIAIFADTHFSDNYTIDDFNKAITLINQENPDLILFLGDLFDNYSTYGDTSAVSQALSDLNAGIGKYAVFGNHDYGGEAENAYEGIMQAGGFTVLKNDTVNFEKYNISLTGVDDFLIGYGDIDSTKDLLPSSYNIVMCHEPDVIDNMINNPIDLMLSGHTHGGQVEIPFYGNLYLPKLGTKYIKGQYDLDNAAKTVLYVNRGLGTTRVEARFLSSPEVTFININ